MISAGNSDNRVHIDIQYSIPGSHASNSGGHPSSGYSTHQVAASLQPYIGRRKRDDSMTEVLLEEWEAAGWLEQRDETPSRRGEGGCFVSNEEELSVRTAPFVPSESAAARSLQVRAGVANCSSIMLLFVCSLPVWLDQKVCNRPRNSEPSYVRCSQTERTT